MSKFCNVISGRKENKSKLEAPLTFQQLEDLADALSREITEAELDFKQKAAYIADRDIQTCVNNEKLTKLNEDVQRCASIFSIVDEEITKQEGTLLEITKIVNRMEKREKLMQYSPQYHTELAAILALIEVMDTQMARANSDIESISHILAVEKISPCTSEETKKVIISILNLHLDLLLNIERSLKRMHENSEFVEELFQILRQ